MADRRRRLARPRRPRTDPTLASSDLFELAPLAVGILVPLQLQPTPGARLSFLRARPAAASQTRAYTQGCERNRPHRSLNAIFVRVRKNACTQRALKLRARRGGSATARPRRGSEQADDLGALDATRRRCSQPRRGRGRTASRRAARAPCARAARRRTRRCGSARRRSTPWR